MHGRHLTQIRTFDKRPLYIPNSVFANIAMENSTHMSHRRIHEAIGIRYHDADKMGRIVQQVKERLMAHPEIANDQAMIDDHQLQ